MRTFAALLAAAGCAATLAACGSSDSKTAPETVPTPSSASATPTVGGKAGFHAPFVCDAIAPATLDKVLPSGHEDPAPFRFDKDVNACAWVGKDGFNTVVAVLFTEASDRDFYRDGHGWDFSSDGLKLANEAAGTGYERSVYVTLDVGARSITVYGLSDPRSRLTTAQLSLVANQLNDAVVDADRAAR